MKNCTVSAEWLYENRARQDLVVLYTRIADIASGEIESTGQRIILDARLFDYENDFVDPDAKLPHTMPSPQLFNQKAKQLGINKESFIVIYDSRGLFSSPRAWWMFKAMGHDNVYVLEGGLPSWLAAQLPVSDTPKANGEIGNFEGAYKDGAFVTAVQISAACHHQPQHLIFDARTYERFKGIAPEPRQGIRSGHIPSSVSLPFKTMLDGTRLKPAAAIKNIFKENSEVDLESHLYFSCGSGVTACVLALAAYSIGFENLHVYDGSWTEWGGNPNYPVEV